jgi:hypothetical protein
MSSSISFLLSLLLSFLLIFANGTVCFAQSPVYSGQGYNGYASQPFQPQASLLAPPKPAVGNVPGYLAPGSQPPANLSNFWQTGAGNLARDENVIGENVVLTGILDDDLSSKTSKVGDVFAIVLEDGYVVSGKTLIPKGSRIIGSVAAVTPAKSLYNGYPGTLQISLQSLVLPDGSNMPVYAFLDHNPNSTVPPPNQQRKYGVPVAQYGKSLSSGLLTSLGSLGTRAGLPFANAHYRKPGNDFVLKKGEMLPVRLNRSLDLRQITPIKINN